MSNPPRTAFENPAADAGDLLIRLGLLLLAVVVPVSVILSRRALFTLVPVGAGLVLFGGLLLPHTSVAKQIRSMLGSVTGLGGLSVLAWCALSLLWTPFPVDAVERLWKTGGTVAVVAVMIALLPERARTSNLYLFPAGLAAASLATIAVMVLTPGALLAIQPDDSTPERAAISLVVLVWPAIGALAVRDRWAASALLAVLVAAAAVVAWTSTALAALGVGALAFVAATFGPQRVSRVFGILIAALLLLAPGLPFALAPVADAAVARFGTAVPALNEVAGTIHVWSGMVRAQPLRLLTGHGFDVMSHAVSSGYVPAPAPRSLLFEIWFELGLIGAVAAAVFALGAFEAVGRSSATVAPFLIAELAAGFTVVLWGADTTQLWWVTFLGVGAVAFVHVIRGQYRTDRPRAMVVQADRAEPRLSA